jgi:hypothetical protein
MKFDVEFQFLQAALKIDAIWLMRTLFYSCCSYHMYEIIHSVHWIGAGDAQVHAVVCRPVRGDVACAPVSGAVAGAGVHDAD